MAVSKGDPDCFALGRDDDGVVDFGGFCGSDGDGNGDDGDDGDGEGLGNTSDGDGALVPPVFMHFVAPSWVAVLEQNPEQALVVSPEVLPSRR